MSAERTSSPELARLLAFAEPGGPALDEALALLSHLRQTPEERRAIDGLLSRRARAALPDALLVAVVTALVDRGEDAAAARAIGAANSSPALMIRAELLARAGDLAAAIALVERVLLRDVDWPGARERYARWREELGIAVPPRLATPATETMVATRPEAPFELLREVGRGGAAVVYEARDRELGRRVALKVYHQPERDRAQLLHEARVAVALAGPGIVRVFDVDPGQGWLALEWAELGALRSRLRPEAAGSRASIAPIARWATPLARALARVHAAGWVHHDVKPANVLLKGEGAPLLGDFGTARRAGEPSPPGSLGYLSPERLAGRASDPRDDVYGFGRVIEDSLDALDAPTLGEERRANLRWRALAARCTGPDESRPAGGAELLAEALEVEPNRG